MIFGNKNMFAIEFEIVDKQISMVIGHFCYWIDGKRIGDFSLITYLNDVLLFMPWIIHDIGNRKYDCNIYNLSWQDIFETIRVSIYEDESETFINCPARFDISIQVEALLGGLIFYIEDDTIGHIIYRYSSYEVNEFSIEKGYVDRVLLKTYKDLTEIFDSFQ